MPAASESDPLGPSIRSRPYRSEADLEQMQALLMDGRFRRGDWRFPHVGDLMWWFFMVVCHLDPAEHVRLWHSPRGRLIAYAMLGEDPTFDCQVLPGYEWAGIEEQALGWAESVLARLRGREPERWGGGLVSGARLDDSARRGFLLGHGFSPAGYTEVNLIRPLGEALPASVEPPGVRVRSFEPGNETAGRAEVQREVWRPWTVGNVNEGDYRRLTALPGYLPELDIVAVTAEGVIAAYVNGWIDPSNRIGDFGPVGTRPEFRRQGLGYAVLLEALRRMQGMGMDRVCVSTGQSNLPALRLYHSLGFRIVNKYLEYHRVA